MWEHSRSQKAVTQLFISQCLSNMKLLLLIMWWQLIGVRTPCYGFIWAETRPCVWVTRQSAARVARWFSIPAGSWPPRTRSTQFLIAVLFCESEIQPKSCCTCPIPPSNNRNAFPLPLLACSSVWFQLFILSLVLRFPIQRFQKPMMVHFSPSLFKNTRIQLLMLSLSYCVLLFLCLL